MSSLLFKATYLAPVMIVLMSSVSMAGYGAPLDRIDCHAVRAKDLLPGGQTFRTALEVSADSKYASYAKNLVCGEGEFLSMMKAENEAMARMMEAGADADTATREIGKAFKQFRPDLSIAPWLQYCQDKISLDQALVQVNDAASHELEFGKKLDQILGSDSMQAQGCEYTDAVKKNGEGG